MSDNFHNHQHHRGKHFHFHCVVVLGAQQISGSWGAYSRKCPSSGRTKVHMERTGDGDGDDNNHDGNADHDGVDDQWSPRMFSLVMFLFVWRSKQWLVWLPNPFTVFPRRLFLNSRTHFQALMLALQGIEEQSDFSVPTGVDEIEKNIRTQIRRRSKLNLEDLKPTFA